MLMTFSHAHAVILCEPKGFTKAFWVKDDDSRKIAQIQATGKDRISDEAEGLTKPMKNLKWKTER
jgi:hypothetical protein